MLSERKTSFSSLQSIQEIGFLRKGQAVRLDALPGLERVQAEKALESIADLDRYLDLIGPVEPIQALIVHMDSMAVYRSQPDFVELSWETFLNPYLLKMAILKSVVMQYDPEGLFASHLEYEVLAAFLLEMSGQSGGRNRSAEDSLFSQTYLTHLDTWDLFCAGETESEPLWRTLCPSILRSERKESFPRWSSLESWMVALLTRSFRDLGWRDRIEFARIWLENRQKVRGQDVFFAHPSYHLIGLDELELEIRNLLHGNFHFLDSQAAGANFRKLLDQNLGTLFNGARRFHLVFEHHDPRDLSALHAYFLRLNHHSPEFKVTLSSEDLHAFPPGPWLRWPRWLPEDTPTKHLVVARCNWPTLKKIQNWASSYQGMDQVVIVQDCPEMAEPLDFYGLLVGGDSSFVGRNIKHSLVVFDVNLLNKFLDVQETDFRMSFTSRLRPQTPAELSLLGRLEWNPKLHAFEQRSNEAALRWLRAGSGEILQLEKEPGS